MAKNKEKFDLFNLLNSKGWVPEGKDYDSLTTKEMKKIKKSQKKMKKSHLSLKSLLRVSRKKIV